MSTGHVDFQQRSFLTNEVNVTKDGPHLDRESEVYYKLRELIVWGRLAPGARVIGLEIAERLGVSRTPVRAALFRLLQEGFVAESRGGRRSRLIVAPLTKDDSSELLHIIGVLEGQAGWYAAQLDSPPRKALVGRLKKLNDKLSKLAGERLPDGKAFYDEDERFHRQYVDAAARPRIRALHAAIRPQAERYIRVYLSVLQQQFATSVDEHVAIIGALEAGEPEVAQVAIQTNWRNAARRLDPVIDSVGERGTW